MLLHRSLYVKIAGYVFKGIKTEEEVKKLLSEEQPFGPSFYPILGVSNLSARVSIPIDPASGFSIKKDIEEDKKRLKVLLDVLNRIPSVERFVDYWKESDSSTGDLLVGVQVHPWKTGKVKFITVSWKPGVSGDSFAGLVRALKRLDNVLSSWSEVSTPTNFKEIENWLFAVEENGIPVSEHIEVLKGNTEEIVIEATPTICTLSVPDVRIVKEILDSPEFVRGSSLKPNAHLFLEMLEERTKALKEEIVSSLPKEVASEVIAN